MLRRFFIVLDTLFVLSLIGIGWTMYFSDDYNWSERLRVTLVLFAIYGTIRWIALGKLTPFDFGSSEKDTTD